MEWYSPADYINDGLYVGMNPLCRGAENTNLSYPNSSRRQRKPGKHGRRRCDRSKDVFDRYLLVIYHSYGK